MNKPTDTQMLNWLIRNGYAPAKWRPWMPSDGPVGDFPNGAVCLGRGGRRDIRKAMKAHK